MKFTKMHGIGNDYVYVNCFEETVENPSDVAVRVSDRHFGIGSDGLILIKPSLKADFQMEMYNADGSLGAMCGNGIRCVAKYVYDHGLTDKTQISVETGSGIKYLELTVEPSDARPRQRGHGTADSGSVKGNSDTIDVSVSDKNDSKNDSGSVNVPARGTVRYVRVDMGAPILDPEQIPVDLEAMKKCRALSFGGQQPDLGVSSEAASASSPVADQARLSGLFGDGRLGGNPVVGETVCIAADVFSITCVSMGNPHCIVPVKDVDGLVIEKIGPAFENHPMFPDRVNTEFIHVIDRNTVQMRVWERGSGETLACGTGACAVAVASILNGWTDDRLTVKLRGGDLLIEWDREKNTVYMTGPAETVFEGEICV
ncbi:MAG: diaminopimelate epimerase [Lachnospiraceae bacterium]|nr:diaminopimelate epimerase [Lachnospiraceae bacterium]